MPNNGISIAGIKPVTPLGIASVVHKIMHKINIANPYLTDSLTGRPSNKKNIRKAIISEMIFFRMNIILFYKNVLFILWKFYQKDLLYINYV